MTQRSWRSAPAGPVLVIRVMHCSNAEDQAMAAAASIPRLLANNESWASVDARACLMVDDDGVIIGTNDPPVWIDMDDMPGADLGAARIVAKMEVDRQIRINPV